MRVAILPTGRAEWAGLAPALNNLFLDHEFYSLPSEKELQSDPEFFPNGFTSSELSQKQVSEPPEAARDLIERAAQAVSRDRKRPAADLVLIIDDLELHNRHQPRQVVAVMSSAVAAYLKDVSVSPGRGPNQITDLLRDKVSFHLIAPMIEAWFFADNSALAAAGVTAETPIHFAPTTDPEAFQTSDPAYLAATAATDCPEFASLPRSRQKNHRPKWLGSRHPRQHHPKGYLQWLCRDPAARNCTTYKETEDGAAALKDLDWQAISTRHPAHFAYLRALIEDISHGLGCQPAISLGPPHGPPPTALDATPRDSLLRNL